MRPRGARDHLLLLAVQLTVVGLLVLSTEAEETPGVGHGVVIAWSKTNNHIQTWAHMIDPPHPLQGKGRGSSRHCRSR